MKAIIFLDCNGDLCENFIEPLPFLKICGKQILSYNIEILKKSGISNILVLTEHYREKAENFLKSHISLWEDSNVWVQENISTEICTDEDYLLMDGNLILTDFIENFLEFQRIKNTDCSALISEDISEDNLSLSVEKSGNIIDFAENPTKENVNLQYCFENILIAKGEILKENLSENSTGNVLKSILKKKIAVNSCKTFEKILLINNVCDFFSCKNFFLKSEKNSACSNFANKNYPGVTFIPPVYVGKNVTIERGCVLKNCVIEDNAVILSKSRISDSYAGENTFISYRCELKNCITGTNTEILSGVKISGNSLVGDCCQVGKDTLIKGESRILPFVKIPDREIINSRVIKDTIISGNKIHHIDEEGNLTVSGDFFNPENCVKTGRSIATALNTKDTVFVGYGEKEISAKISENIKSGLLSSGINVCDVGKCTLPMLVFALTKEKGRLCIFSDFLSRGKITVLEKGGVPVKRNFELAFENAYKQNSFRKIHGDNFPVCVNGECEKLFYENYVNGLLPEKFKNLNVEIRTDSPLLAEISDRIFPCRNDINGEKIVFNISHRGKECSVYTENTGNISYEKLVCLCAMYTFENKGAVALPYTFSTAVDYIAEEKNGILYRYFNSPLDDKDFNGRQTAGKLKNLFTADGFILAAKVCKILQNKNENLYALMKKIPQLCNTQRFVSSDINISRLSNTFECDLTRNYEGFSVNRRGGRIIVRPLKNGGGMDIFAQAENWETASDLCDEVINRIKFLENTKNIADAEKYKNN